MLAIFWLLALFFVLDLDAGTHVTEMTLSVTLTFHFVLFTASLAARNTGNLRAKFGFFALFSSRPTRRHIDNSRHQDRTVEVLLGRAP